MKKFLLIGDDERARYHPLPPVQDGLMSAIDGVEWTVLYDYLDLTADDLLGYDLVVSYVDLWGVRDTARASQAFLDAFDRGLRMLVLHGGMIVHGDPALIPVYGATFTGHPARADLRFTPADHPACVGAAPFVLFEEPYQFAFLEDVPRVPLLSYEYEGTTCPAGWVTRPGTGLMAYLHPGHDAQVFQDEGFRRLLRGVAAWCAA